MPDLAQEPDALTQSLAEPSRRAMLEQLRLGPKSVSELVCATGLKQPNVSNHLAKMRQQGIVQGERVGRNVYYGITEPIAEFLMSLHAATATTLARAAVPHSGGGADTAHSAPAGGCQIGVDGVGQPADPAPLPIADWRACFLDAVRSGNEDRAQALVNSMLARRISLAIIFTEIFEWALYRIGELYESGLADVGQEHLVSGLVERLMARVTHFYTPVTRCRRRAVLGCVAGNWHALGVRMLADALRTAGWETRFLGANVPTDSFLSFARSEEALPDLVVISCSMEDQVEELRRLVRALDAARTAAPGMRCRIVIGGHCLNSNPDLTKNIPADLVAPNLTVFLSTIGAIFARSDVTCPAEKPSAGDAPTLCLQKQ